MGMLVLVFSFSACNDPEQDAVTKTSASFVKSVIEVGTNPLIGVWEYGFGDSITTFFTGRRMEFFEDGTIIYEFTANIGVRPEVYEISTDGLVPSTGVRTGVWEITDDGQLAVTCDVFGIRDYFAFDLTGDHLILTEERGHTRTWWQVGTKPIQDNTDLLGIWEYGHGHRFEGYNSHPMQLSRSGMRRPPAIKFKDEQFFFLNPQSDQPFEQPFSRGGRTWELTDENQFTWDFSDTYFIFEINGDSLIITDEWGQVGTWYRVGAERDDSWIMTQYLPYFEIDDGYRIVRNVKITGDQFDFVVFDLESETGNEWRKDWYFIVVVKSDDVVFDVIHHDPWDTDITVNNLVIEIDLTFDGYNDILLFDGNHLPPWQTHDWFRRYAMFTQRDGRFEYVPSFSNICVPHLDLYHRRIVTSAITTTRLGWDDEYVDTCQFGSAIYEFINDEWILMGTLSWDHEERLLINGQWQERQLCGTRNAGSFELCKGFTEEDLQLYERIFGEHPYWRRIGAFHWDIATWYKVNETRMRIGE